MITSPQNSKLKLVKALLTQSKARHREKQMVLEGTRLIQDVIQQGIQPDFVLHKPGVEISLENAFPVEPHLLDELSDTQSPQGILGVFPLPELPIPESATFLVALDGVRDPGNLGTIIRTAAAAGVTGLLLLPGTVDAFNPKTVRAGMGNHYRIPIQSLNWHKFEQLYSQDWFIWQAKAEGGTIYHQADWQSKTLLIMGGEAHGLSETASEYAKNIVSIPMANGVESLNSAVATAILVFEIQRQRGIY
ncbi:MAG: RNA methyltransferase [Anaerolineae bacterium]|nr:RNA methyltransferase [Anaerolineae bacterium]